MRRVKEGTKEIVSDAFEILAATGRAGGQIHVIGMVNAITVTRLGIEADEILPK